MDRYLSTSDLPPDAWMAYRVITSEAPPKIELLPRIYQDPASAMLALTTDLKADSSIINHSPGGWLRFGETYGALLSETDTKLSLHVIPVSPPAKVGTYWVWYVIIEDLTRDRVRLEPTLYPSPEEARTAVELACANHDAVLHDWSPGVGPIHPFLDITTARGEAARIHLAPVSSQET